jgi:hypothetical protein
LRRPRQGPRGTHRHGHVDDLCGDARDPLKIAKAVRGPPEVRATLATISDDAYNEYLDLRSLEETREEVAGTPSPDSRDWLKDGDE